MIKAIIFDLNGVFIQSPKLSDRFKQDFGISSDIFISVLKEIIDKVRKPGANPIYNYWQPYFKEWGLELNEWGFLKYWFEAEKENKEMVKLAKSLKKQGLSIFILSNNFRERAEYYKKNFSFLNEIFDKVYYSWQTGFTKPNKKCFELIIKENNLKSTECLYFDDSEKNIEMAKSLGINSYIFENEKETKTIILKHNNLNS